MSDSDTTTTPARRALRTALRAGEYGLALAGSVCLIAYGGACARASLTQQRESDAFDQALRARQAEIQQQFESEIGIHFEAEEKELFPVAARYPELLPLVEELLADHDHLRDCFSRAATRSLA
jgi:hypothetical protein